MNFNVNWEYYNSSIDSMRAIRSMTFTIFVVLDLITTLYGLHLGLQERSFIFNFFGTDNLVLFLGWALFIKLLLFLGMEVVIVHFCKKKDTLATLGFFYGILFFMGLLASAQNMTYSFWLLGG
jgi:hypothetical protein